MKLIIDINDHEYIGIKQYPNNITSYPVTIHLYDAVRNGTPLDKIRDEIEAEMNDLYRQPSIDQRTLTIIHACQRHIAIIDKYESEVTHE